MIFTKTQGRSSSNSGYEIQKICGLNYNRTGTPLARKYTDRIFESKDGTTSMKIVNYIERHNFCCNYLLTKSNRTEIQTYEVEERIFGTPCNFIFIFLFRTHKHLQYITFAIHYNNFSLLVTKFYLTLK